MLDKIALTLLIIGGLNWGSVGLFQFDVIAWICGGSGSVVARILYVLVALAALWCISLLFRDTAAGREHDHDHNHDRRFSTTV
ncbi:MAG: DUF378 domain-containing protein [Oscillospiraceae bacterium]|nr:DUF378 domain-containing protein [Oscillospiraceae bacterium]